MKERERQALVTPTIRRSIDSTISISTPLSYATIFALQDALLKPGVHHMAFDSRATSNTVLNTWLSVSQKRAGFFGSSSCEHRAHTLIFTELCAPMIHEHIYGVDFLWADLTSELSDSAYAMIEEIVVDFHVRFSIPMIISTLD